MPEARRILTDSEFYQNFTEVTNTVEDGEMNGEERFETYGADLEHVMSTPERNVWTCVDADGGLYLLPGFHYVNRLYYVITEEEWTDDILEVKLLSDEEMEDFDNE